MLLSGINRGRLKLAWERERRRERPSTNGFDFFLSFPRMIRKLVHFEKKKLGKMRCYVSWCGESWISDDEGDDKTKFVRDLSSMHDELAWLLSLNSPLERVRSIHHLLRLVAIFSFIYSQSSISPASHLSCMGHLASSSSSFVGHYLSNVLRPITGLMNGDSARAD